MEDLRSLRLYNEYYVVVVVSLFSSNVHSRITKYKNTNFMSHVTHKCLRDQWWNIAGGSQGSRSSSSWQPLWLLITWWCKDPGHQKKSYWSVSSGTFQNYQIIKLFFYFQCVFELRFVHRWLQNATPLDYCNELVDSMASIHKKDSTGIRIFITNLRRSDDHLRFIMGIPIPINRCRLSA